MAAWALRPVRPVKALTEPEEPTRETLLLSWYDIEELRARGVTATVEKPWFDHYYKTSDGKLNSWEDAHVTSRNDGREGAWLPPDA